MPATAAERSLAGQAAAHSKWARTRDRSAATAPARAAFEDRFLRQVDPDGTMTPDERARAADAARSAYYSDLGRRGMKARRQAREARDALAAVVAEERAVTMGQAAPADNAEHAAVAS